MITIRVYCANPDVANAMWQRLERIETFGQDLVEAAIGAVHDVIEETFEGEGAAPSVGSAPWAPLLATTQEIRRGLLGEHRAAHPILHRYGKLKAAMLDESDSLHVVERRRVGAANFIGKVGTNDIRFEWHQTGDDPSQPSGYITPRPIWVEGPAEERFVDNLDELLGQLIRDKL